jgi:ATP-binding protein involved in chromosome partitioning
MVENGRPARRILAVASGKGGVGKSTIALNLALALSHRGSSVGILDADLYGPDIPAMLGLTRTEEATQWTLWRRGGAWLRPIERRGVKVMSAGFLLGERQIMPWESQTLPFVLRQLLHGVEWGGPDYLVIDLPPGTADLQVTVFREAALDAALLVVGPQDVAHLDAKKVATLLRDANVPLIGAVENMAQTTCPHCGRPIELFPAVVTERSLWDDGVRRLASIPLDPALAQLNGGPPPVFYALAEDVERALE